MHFKYCKALLPYKHPAVCRLHQLHDTKNSNTNRPGEFQPAGHRLGGCRRRERPLQHSLHPPSRRGPLWPAAAVRQHTAPRAAAARTPTPEPVPTGSSHVWSASMPPSPQHVPSLNNGSSGTFLHAPHAAAHTFKPVSQEAVARFVL